MLPGRISIKKEKLEDGITLSTVDTCNTIQEARTQREDSGKGNYRCLYDAGNLQDKHMYVVDMPKERRTPLQ